MSSSCLYHCPCEPPTSLHAYHPLPTLYFCDECDDVRCPACVLCEVASYYCPNCLFEVPQASVRAEKNRCARNCFVCPAAECGNTLSVVASDPPAAGEDGDSVEAPGPSTAAASVGVPPYYFACQACRWDSKSSLGIIFEKPTGLAGQLAKMEEGALQFGGVNASSEYERIREHLEPFVKAGQQQAAAAAAAAIAAAEAGHTAGGKGKDRRTGYHPTTTNAIAAAARALSHSSSAMAKDIPSSIASASRFNSLHNLAVRASSLGKPSTVAAMSTGRDELEIYVSKTAAAAAAAAKKGKSVPQVEQHRVDTVKKAKRLHDLPLTEQKWAATYAAPVRATEVRPQRLPLQAKRTKRCHVCRHIVVKVSEPVRTCVNQSARAAQDRIILSIIRMRLTSFSLSSRVW